jgi:hypothetical protein
VALPFHPGLAASLSRLVVYDSPDDGKAGRGRHERIAKDTDQMLLVDQGQRGGKADVTSPHDRSDQSTRSA